MKTYYRLYSGIAACLISFSAVAFTTSITKTVPLSDGRTAVVYNHGSKIVIKDTAGNIQQTACFSPCGISFKKADGFLSLLQTVVKKNNAHEMAQLIHYPLYIRKLHLTLKNAADFEAHYKSIMTEELRNAILTQEPYALFANSQGIMIGSGQLWFSKTPNASGLYIIAINL